MFEFDYESWKLKYRESGYLCGNIIYANYASSCEGT